MTYPAVETEEERVEIKVVSKKKKCLNKSAKSENFHRASGFIRDLSFSLSLSSLLLTRERERETDGALRKTWRTVEEKREQRSGRAGGGEEVHRVNRGLGRGKRGGGSPLSMTLSLSPHHRPVSRVLPPTPPQPYTYRTRTRISGTHTPNARCVERVETRRASASGCSWCCASRERDKDVAGEKRERKKKRGGYWVGGLRVEEG